MSYEKHEWQTGEVITADKLNNIESGIETLYGGIPTVKFDAAPENVGAFFEAITSALGNQNGYVLVKGIDTPYTFTDSDSSLQDKNFTLNKLMYVKFDTLDTYIMFMEYEADYADKFRAYLCQGSYRAMTGASSFKYRQLALYSEVMEVASMIN